MSRDTVNLTNLSIKSQISTDLLDKQKFTLSKYFKTFPVGSNRIGKTKGQKVLPRCHSRRVVSSLWFYNVALGPCVLWTDRLKLAKQHQEVSAGEITPPLSFSLSGFKPNFIQYFLSLHSGKEWMCLSTCFPAIIHCNEIHTDYVLIKSPLEDTVWILNKTQCQFALCSSKSILHSTTIWISRKKVREFLMLVAEGAGNPNHVSDHLCNISQSVLSSIYNKYTHNTDTKEQVGVQGSCFSPSQLLQR